MPSASGRAPPAFTPPVTTFEIWDHSCSGGVCQAEEPSYNGVSSPAREKHRRSLKGRGRGRVYLVCAADLRRVDQILSRQCLDICRAACFYVELMAPWVDWLPLIHSCLLPLVRRQSGIGLDLWCPLASYKSGLLLPWWHCIFSLYNVICIRNGVLRGF